ncbi:hypothetical protein KIW84_021250 [Lathyrus oleraceus]|uniref:Pentatricopeptide repeat-containing protein n=1 Tax=Pisum sativum TaxID=3888 RepID=A0A9D5B911_PEA|nr:hypothetical protein KIW84_021250 [Pisum sativum]
MCRKRVKLDQHLLSSTLKACVEIEDLNTGVQVHGLMIKNGHQNDCFVASVLLTLYAGSGELGDVEKLFRRIDDKDIVAWNSMILARARPGHGSSFSMQLLLELRRTTLLQIESAILVAVLKSCENESDLLAGNISKALQLFENMKRNTVITWTTMISGLALHGIGEESLHVFACMEKEVRIKPNEVTFISILSAWSHVGLVELGRDYFTSMRSGKLVLQMPFEANAAIWGSLLAASTRCGDIDLAAEALRHLVVLEPHHCGNYSLLSNAYASLVKTSSFNLGELYLQIQQKQSLKFSTQRYKVFSVEGKGIELGQPVNVDSSSQWPVSIDAQESCSNAALLGFGIVEKCNKHDTISNLLKSGTAEPRTDGANIDLIEVAVVLPKQQQQTMSNCYKIIHNVALEIGISPDTLTANINLQEGYMAPDVQHEIVNWLKAHVYTGAFHKGLKAKIKPANVSLDGSGASDGSDTSPLSDSGLPNPVAVNVKSVPPRRRTISNIRILKDNKVICSTEGFTTSENGVSIDKFLHTTCNNSSNRQTHQIFHCRTYQIKKNTTTTQKSV